MKLELLNKAYKINIFNNNKFINLKMAFWKDSSK